MQACESSYDPNKKTNFLGKRAVTICSTDDEKMNGSTITCCRNTIKMSLQVSFATAGAACNCRCRSQLQVPLATAGAARNCRCRSQLQVQARFNMYVQKDQ